MNGLVREGWTVDDVDLGGTHWEVSRVSHSFTYSFCYKIISYLILNFTATLSLKFKS